MAVEQVITPTRRRGNLPKEIEAPKKEKKELGDFDKVIDKFLKTPPPPKVKKEKKPSKKEKDE